MIKLKYAVVLLTMSLMLFSCIDKDEINRYERPEWLAGKVYTQVADNDSLTTFAKCIKAVGYDTIIDVSGSYTVFAPINEAMAAWMQENQYAAVEDIPHDRLLRLVKYHIVQNPWSKKQLRSLDMYGWIDTLDLSNDEPRGFKRQTLLKENNRRYGVRLQKRGLEEIFAITDSLEAGFFRRVITDSRKYVPFFYDEYLSIYNLNAGDYEYYFERPYTGGDDIYFANAKTIDNEIFAENGIVYKIDEVVEPALNAYQLLERDNAPQEYSKYLELVNIFPNFIYDQEETNDQEGAELGLLVDSLFSVSYTDPEGNNDLVFDIINEKAKKRAESGNDGNVKDYSVRYHHGLFAPTNAAFDKLISDYIAVPGGWGNLSSTPTSIKKIIANSHMSYDPVFPSNFATGIINGEDDIVTFDESLVEEKIFASNCTFLGLGEAVVPRAFQSITGPIYLQPGYSWVMAAIEQAGLLPALKRPNKDYMFFVENDNDLRLDSSLYYYPVDEKFLVFQQAGQGAEAMKFSVTVNDLRILLLNHVATSQPKGIARKEFIPNMAGNFIVVNNETGEVSGTAETTSGYNGSEQMANFPRSISENTDNGSTYRIDNWFSFSASSIYASLQSGYPKFFVLMRNAGLLDTKLMKIKFLSDSEFYTIFAPTDAAVDSFDVSGMSKDELANFVKLHFIQGDIIFTDGNKASGNYLTTRVDERSTEFTTFYSEMYVETGIDYIKLLDRSGSEITQIEESEKTNKLTGITIPPGKNEINLFGNIYNNAVIHEIDTVLVY